MVAVLLLASCSATAPVHYYQLSSQHEVAISTPGGFGALEIGVGPVTLPTYLDRPQIATRTSVNQLSFADSHRWAEPLSENFTRVLADNLSQRLGTDRIQFFPWPRRYSIDRQLVIEVIQFENLADGSAVLEVRWTVRGKADEVILPARHSRFERPASGSGQADRIASLSQTVADLCQEIATRLVPL